MSTIEWNGRLVESLAALLRGWEAAGKLEEDDFERALSTEARAWVDHSIAPDDWAAAVDVEGMVALAADQLGDASGLVECADEMVEGLRSDPLFDALLRSASELPDGPGFMVSHSGERLARAVDWSYEGGRNAFSVRMRGLEGASPALKALFGQILARLAAVPTTQSFDVRVEGIDAEELVVFGVLDPHEGADAEERLHRAALIP